MEEGAEVNIADEYAFFYFALCLSLVLSFFKQYPLLSICLAFCNSVVSRFILSLSPISLGRLRTNEVSFGFTPLHLVVQLGDMTLVKLLLSHGADPKLKSKEGSATEIAEMCRHTAIHAKLVKVEKKPLKHLQSADSKVLVGLPKVSSMPNVASNASPAHAPAAFRSFDELNSLSLQGTFSYILPFAEPLLTLLSHVIYQAVDECEASGKTP